MAKKAEKLTKARILKLVEEKLQALYLLKSALQADQSRKQEDLDRYYQQYREIVNQ